MFSNWVKSNNLYVKDLFDENGVFREPLYFRNILIRKLNLYDAAPPPARDTQLPFDILSITMFYTCLVTEVVYQRGNSTVWEKIEIPLYPFKEMPWWT